MFGKIKYLISGVKVVERDGIIKITNFPPIFANGLQRDLQSVYNTSKIILNIFNKVDKNEISFYSFFAPDVAFIFRRILEMNRYRRCNPRILRKVLEELEIQTWLKIPLQPVSSKINRQHLDFFTLTAMPHQEEFFDQYNNLTQQYMLNGFLLAAAPGSGKTYTSLALMRILEKDVTIIISPKNAVFEVWEANLTKYTKVTPKYWISARDKAKGFDMESEYFIFHYEDLALAMELLDKVKGRNVGIIVDECHNFTDLSSQRTDILVKFCIDSKSEDILYMSGTPLKAIGHDCIPFIKSVDRFFTLVVEERFKALYGKSVSRAVEVLANRIGLMSFKVEKKVVRPDVPTPVEIPVKIVNGDRYTLTNIRDEVKVFIKERVEYYESQRVNIEQQYAKCMEIVSDKLGPDKGLKIYKLYVSQIRQGYDPKSMKQEAMYCNKYELKVIIPLLPANLRPIFKDIRSAIKYVDLKIQGEALGRIVGKRRMECNLAIMPHAKLEEIVDRGEKKTVIFSSYVEVANATYKYFKDLGWSPLIVYAETNSQLSEIVKSFEVNEDINPLIATFQSLSTAVPLVMANQVILLDQPFRHYILDQAISRVDRLGQDTEVFVYSPLLDTDGIPNISTRSKDIMEVAKEMVAAIMNKPIIDDIASLEDLTEDLEGGVLKAYLDEQKLPASASW